MAGLLICLFSLANYRIKTRKRKGYFKMTDNETIEDVNEPTKEKVSTVSIGDIVADPMPEVKQNAIDAIHGQKAEEITKAVKVDGFNPEIHVVGADGQPKRNKNGSLKKKRGRKKGTTSPSKSTLNIEDKKEELVEQISSYETAVTISGLLEMAQVKMISDEFLYLEIERCSNIEAWQKTLDYYGGVNLTPPQILFLSHMQIILTRAMGEKNIKTKEKFAYFKTWINQKVKRFSFKKENKNGSHADSGENPKRKDDTGEKTSAGKTKTGD